MEYLILIVCVSLVFLFLSIGHIYTMVKINKVQDKLLKEGGDWVELDKAALASLYTMLMLFLFSLLLSIPVITYVKMYMLVNYVVGG